jgi:hypothetical protein
LQLSGKSFFEVICMLRRETPVTVEGQTVEAQAMNWVYILVKVLTP